MSSLFLEIINFWRIPEMDIRHMVPARCAWRPRQAARTSGRRPAPAPGRPWSGACARGPFFFFHAREHFVKGYQIKRISRKWEVPRVGAVGSNNHVFSMWISQKFALFRIHSQVFANIVCCLWILRYFMVFREIPMKIGTTVTSVNVRLRSSRDLAFWSFAPIHTNPASTQTFALRTPLWSSIFSSQSLRSEAPAFASSACFARVSLARNWSRASTLWRKESRTS